MRVADTLTNAAYLFAGFVAFSQGAHLLGGALAVLAIASGTFHWTEEKSDQRADEIAMYGVLTALIGFVAGLPAAATFAAFAVLAAFHLRLPSFPVIGVLAAIALVFVALESLITAAVAGVLFGLALYVRRFEWGHSAWHIASSAAILAAIQ